MSYKTFLFILKHHPNDYSYSIYRKNKNQIIYIRLLTKNYILWGKLLSILIFLILCNFILDTDILTVVLSKVLEGNPLFIFALLPQIIIIRYVWILICNIYMFYIIRKLMFHIYRTILFDKSRFSIYFKKLLKQDLKLKLDAAEKIYNEACKNKSEYIDIYLEDYNFYLKHYRSIKEDDFDFDEINTIDIWNPVTLNVVNNQNYYKSSERPEFLISGTRAFKDLLDFVNYSKKNKDKRTKFWYEIFTAFFLKESMVLLNKPNIVKIFKYLSRYKYIALFLLVSFCYCFNKFWLIFLLNITKNVFFMIRFFFICYLIKFFFFFYIIFEFYKFTYYLWIILNNIIYLCIYIIIIYKFYDNFFNCNLYFMHSYEWNYYWFINTCIKIKYFWIYKQH